MKKFLFILAFIFSVSMLAQNTANSSEKIFKITQKKCVPRKGFHLRLKQVFDDSRCPEGTTCVWAGEVSVVVEAYKNKKSIEEKTLVLGFKSLAENKKWFAQYLSDDKKNIKSIDVVPYPKKDKTIKAKDYFIRITYEK